MRQFRAEVRKPSNGQADISWEIGAGYVRTSTAVVRDTSKSGMGLVVSQPFAVGTTLRIKFESETRSAIVRRCVCQGAKHLVGVQFERQH